MNTSEIDLRTVDGGGAAAETEPKSRSRTQLERNNDADRLCHIVFTTVATRPPTTKTTARRRCRLPLPRFVFLNA